MSDAGRRVLLADDELMMRQVLRSILDGGKFVVVGDVMNGDSVLQKCLQLKPDILCLDINMPGKNWIDTLQELRTRLPDLKVLMISGDASAQTVKEAIAQGVSGFIAKPFSPAKVLDCLQQIIRA